LDVRAVLDGTLTWERTAEGGAHRPPQGGRGRDGLLVRHDEVLG